MDSEPVISITPLWTFETVMPDEHVARRCPQAEGHQASRSRNEYKGIENILKGNTCVALFRQHPISWFETSSRVLRYSIKDKLHFVWQLALFGQLLNEICSEYTAYRTFPTRRNEFFRNTEQHETACNMAATSSWGPLRILLRIFMMTLGKSLKIFEILPEILRGLSFSCQDLGGSFLFLPRFSRIFHFLAKIFRDLSFSCHDLTFSCQDP